MIQVAQHAPARPELGTRMLALGMRGADVKKLQRLLGLRESGVFCSWTEAALIAFQTRHGLPAAGIAGPRTKSALDSLLIAA